MVRHEPHQLARERCGSFVTSSYIWSRLVRLRVISDNDAIQRLNDARTILFKTILPTTQNYFTDENGCPKLLKTPLSQTQTSIGTYCCVAL